MQKWCSYFKLSPQEVSPQAIYHKLKSEILDHLEKSVARCEKRCVKQYDQERNFLVAYHPEIENKRNIINNTKSKILAELETIENLDSDIYSKTVKLAEYGIALSQLKFNNLCLDIFTGKLQKKNGWIKHKRA